MGQQTPPEGRYTYVNKIYISEKSAFSQVKPVISSSMKLKSVKFTLPVNKFSQYMRQRYKLHFIRVYPLLSNQPYVK